MNIPKTRKVVRIALCAATILPITGLLAQGATVDQQFALSLGAKGADYVAIRESIVARKAEALPSLKSNLNNADWHAQVLADAMIRRIDNPELYVHFERLTIIPIVRVGTMHVRSFYDLAGRRLDPTPGSSAIAEQSNRRARIEKASLPFYLEAALKGSDLRKPTINCDMPNDDSETLYTVDEVAQILSVSRKTVEAWMDTGAIRWRNEFKGGPRIVKHQDLHDFAIAFLRTDSSPAGDAYYSESTRCLAVVTIGDFTDYPNVLPLLTELLQSGETPKIRGYAAIALGSSCDPRAVDPLTQAKSDPDSQVREAVTISLTRLNEIVAELRKDESAPKNW